MIVAQSLEFRFVYAKERIAFIPALRANPQMNDQPPVLKSRNSYSIIRALLGPTRYCVQKIYRMCCVFRQSFFKNNCKR
jgi:hypothetical protein